MLPVVTEAFDEQNLKYEVDEANGFVHLQLRGEEVGLECYVFVNDSTRVVRCYVKPPLWVPEHAYSPMCEAVTRANFSLPFGNFELDLTDGELRYKTSLDVEGGELVPMMGTTSWAPASQCQISTSPPSCR